jgi:ankyrin repeat protein
MFRFLWVAFQIREICEQTCDEDIRGVIAQLPKGLRETYERILQRVCQRGKASIADKVFRWTGTVRRPLTLEEMHEAIAVQPGQDSFRHDRLTNGFFENVVSWCGNLVTVDEESRAVQFAHSTVRQYLFSDDAAPTRFRCVPDEANTHVGEVCVTYLCFSDFERQLVKNSKVAQAVDPTAIASAALSSAGGKALVKPLKMFASMRKGPRIVPVNLLAQRLEDHSVGRSLAAQFSFLAYASQHWIAHTSNFSVTTHAWRHFLRLVLEDSHVASLSSHLRSSNNKMLLKRYIVGLNHKGLMHCLCHCRHHIFDNISLGKLFCECCHRKVVDIAKMALSSTKAVEENMSQWVVAAAEAGLQDVLGMLIDMAPQSESRSSLLALALQSAARGGHCGIVVQMLNVGADVNFPAICTLTALEEAINRPDTEMLELLLDHGAKFGAEPARLIGLKWERSMPTSLRLATWYRRDGLDLRLELRGDRLEFLERLLLAGAAVNCAPPPVCGRTALQAASELGLLDIVERLLVAGADVNAPPAEEFGRTALQAAAGAGDFAIVNRLLDAGAAVDADPAPCWGRTALQAAAEAGHLEIVNRLLEAGANVNEEPASDFGRTALQAAAEAGKLDMVDRLLAAGAEPNAAPCHVGGVTALQAATQAGHPEVMVRLREEGAVEVAEDT